MGPAGKCGGDDLERGDPDSAEIERLVEARTHELSAFSAHLQALTEQEKSQLARTLHDELGGLLTAAKMDLSWLQSRLSGSPMLERLSQLGGVLDEAMDLKRRVVEQLRPSLLDHFGLPAAILCIYGPFRYRGRYTSDSNAAFDEFLRGRDPHSGIRDFEAVDALARAQGLELIADHAMPANNQTLVWCRPATAAG